MTNGVWSVQNYDSEILIKAFPTLRVDVCERTPLTSAAFNAPRLFPRASSASRFLV